MGGLTVSNEAICSVFTIDVERGAVAYQYDVNVCKVEQRGERVKSLAKGADE